jgi:hypothetical protein
VNAPLHKRRPPRIYRIKTVRKAVVILLLTTVARADVSSRDMAREHYKHGMAQYLLNHYDAAILEFEAGFAAEPQAAFLYNLAQCHAKLGHTAQALEFFRKYVDYGVPPEEASSVQATMERLQASMAPAPAPAAPSPEPSLAPTPEPQVVVVPAKAEPARAPPKKRRWPIAVGVIAGGVVALAVGLGAGLGLSGSGPREASLSWSAR